MVEISQYTGRSFKDINSEGHAALLGLLFRNKIKTCDMIDEPCTYFLADNCCHALLTGEADCIAEPVPFDHDPRQGKLFL